MGANVEYGDRYYRIIDTSNYIKAEEECIKNITLEAEEGCINEAPVDTGLLRDSHYSENEGLSGRVMNDVEYAVYVIYGTSRQSANNYPQRVVNELSGSYSERFIEALNNMGVNTQ